MANTVDSLFEEHLREGGPTTRISTTADGSRVCRFEDGGMMQAQPSGHFLHKWADGRFFQLNPDGITIDVDKDGNKTTTRPDGSKVVQDIDGTSTTHLASGQKIICHLDGTRTQIEANGSGIVLSKDNQVIRRFEAESNSTPAAVASVTSNSSCVVSKQKQKQKQKQKKSHQNVPSPSSTNLQSSTTNSPTHVPTPSGVPAPASASTPPALVWDSLKNSWRSPPSSPAPSPRNNSRLKKNFNMRELTGAKLRQYLEGICDMQCVSRLLEAGVTGDDLCDFEDSDFAEFGLSPEQRERILEGARQSPRWRSKDDRCVFPSSQNAHTHTFFQHDGRKHHIPQLVGRNPNSKSPPRRLLRQRRLN